MSVLFSFVFIIFLVAVVVAGKYVRIILNPNLVTFSCIGVGNIPEHGTSLHIKDKCDTHMRDLDFVYFSIKLNVIFV
jgi:hypothetical protein